MTTMHRPALNDSRALLLARILQALSDAHIPVCLLNSYDTLESQASSDIDCRIASEQLPTAVVKALHSNGVVVLQDFQRESSTHVLVLVDCNLPGSSMIWLDAGSDFREAGRIYYQGSAVLHSAVTAGDFMIPQPEIEFGHYLIKKIVQKSLDEPSGSRLSALYRRNPSGSAAEISKFWTPSTAARLIDAAESEVWGFVQRDMDIIRSELLREARRRRPSNLPKYWLPEFSRRLRRFCAPAGLHVVFLGADGSGKSSVIDQVEAKLNGAFRGTSHFHLFPGLFRQSGDGRPVTDPHRLRPRSSIVSIAKVFIWVVDYFLGYYVKVRPKLVRSNLVLFDRYFPDILVDPRRYRYGGPEALNRFIWNILPKPALVILLDAPVTVLHQRKQEVPWDETVRQRDAYRKLVADMPNGHIVDASQSLNDVVEDVSAIIRAHLSSRLLKRLRLGAQQ